MLKDVKRQQQRTAEQCGANEAMSQVFLRYAPPDMVGYKFLHHLHNHAPHTTAAIIVDKNFLNNPEHMLHWLCASGWPYKITPPHQTTTSTFQTSKWASIKLFVDISASKPELVRISCKPIGNERELSILKLGTCVHFLEAYLFVHRCISVIEKNSRRRNREWRR